MTSAGNVRSEDLLDLAPCGLLSLADDGTIRQVNATLLELLGRTREEVLGASVERILTVAGRIFYQTHLFPLLALHGRADEIFLLLKHASGEDVGALVNAVRRERDGVFATDVALMVVRERRKYEDALLRAKRQAEEAQREVELRSRELERSNEQLEEHQVELELQHQQLQEQTAELEAASEELHAINEELAAQTEELERQRQAADEANRAKSTFLATMSHELRTPLNAIAGYVQLLELGIHGPVTEEQREALGRIERSQRRLLGLINDVLNLARIEAGRVDYEIAPVPLAEAVSAVTPMIEPQLGARGLSLAVDVPAALVAHADREKLEQVLLNLLTNAVKFTPRGGRVRVEGTRSEDGSGRVRLCVHDTGIGIPADKLASVFEPFVQVGVRHSRRTEGTGLGLSISRDLARGMGGDLTVRSVEGEGSTFTVELAGG